LPIAHAAAAARNKRGSTSANAPLMVHLDCLVCTLCLDWRDDAGVFVACFSQCRENIRPLGGLQSRFVVLVLERAIFSRSRSYSEPAPRYQRRQEVEGFLDCAGMHGKRRDSFRIGLSHGREDTATNSAILPAWSPLVPLVLATAGLVVTEIAVPKAAVSYAQRTSKSQLPI